MNTKQLHIKNRERGRMSVIAKLSDFEWVEEGATNAEQIVNNPNISLYCLDDERQEAIFVALPAGIDLSRVPFVYQAQFDHAEHLIVVPYPIFHQLADGISVDASQLVCIHNIGRCGSTLLSQALNEIEPVSALSEPDVFANFITIRHTPRDEQIHLLQASYKFMFRPVVVDNANLYVMKLRNQCVDIMKLFDEAFPKAKHLFMYRNAIDWIASFYRLIVKSGNANRQFTRTEVIERQASFLNRQPDDVAPFFDSSIEMYSSITYFAVSWLIMMTRYLDVVERDFKPVAIRYEDLIDHRDEMLSAIFEHISLPDTAVSQAQTAFTRDSQAGTQFARDDAQSGNTIKLPDEDVQVIKGLLAMQPVINQPNFILPNTIRVS